MKFAGKLKNGKEIEIYSRTKISAVKGLEELYGSEMVETIKKTDGRLK